MSLLKRIGKSPETLERTTSAPAKPISSRSTAGTPEKLMRRTVKKPPQDTMVSLKKKVQDRLLAEMDPNADLSDVVAVRQTIKEAYESILGFTPRILVASFLAYTVGEFSNSFVLAKMKIKTKGRWLWARTIGSTIVGEGLDALIFITILYAGRFNLSFIAIAILTHWLIKTGYEVVATPFTYAVVNFLKKKEAIDTYDYDTNFNPFSISV